MSTELIGVFPSIPAMSDAAIEHVRAVEEHLLATQPQFDLPLLHVLHGGMYVRSLFMPGGTIITGALIKIATTVIVDGDAIVWFGDDERRVTGHTILPAAAHRKQGFHALTDTHITMLFPTAAKTVAEAEREFTEEFDRLAPGVATTIITGERA
jgi:hypothetical protein